MTPSGTRNRSRVPDRGDVASRSPARAARSACWDIPRNVASPARHTLAGVSSSPLRIGVLAVQGDVREHVHVLSSLGAQASGVRRPRELDEVDAIVIPGGESTTMDKLVRAFELYDPLGDRIADARPDQQTLGGLDMTVRRNAFGRQVDSFEEDLHMPEVVGADGEPVRAVFIRAPWVEQVGEGVQVLATVEAGPAAGHIVAVRQGNLLATSFHPEVTGDHRVHEYFVQMVRSASA